LPSSPIVPLAQAVAEVETDLADARRLLSALAASPEVRKTDGAACKTLMTRTLEENTRYAQLGATLASGILFCNTNYSQRPQSVADRLYFRRALETQDFAIGEYVIGRITKLPSLGLAYPVKNDDGTFRGVVIAPLKLAWLAQRFAEISIPVTGEMVLLDSYGNILVRDPDAVEWQGRNISETPLGRAMLGDRNGEGTFAGADGEVRRYAFAVPAGSNNRLVVAVGIK
jgi:C4-dicarboxylate-specific signal transduction histidine kinase